MLTDQTGMSLSPTGPLAAIERRASDYVISIRDAAGILTISPRTLWRMLESNKIHGVRLSERRRGILASELSRYLTDEAA